VLGAFASFLAQVFCFCRQHGIELKKFRIHTTWFRQLCLFLLPLGVIWGFQQIPFVILNRFGSGMWEGTISALTIAQTLTTVPMGLVSHTIILAIFPAFAKQASEARADQVRDTFFQTLNGSFMILIMAGFLLTGLARPIASLFFTGGEISLEGTRRIANALVCFGWAIFALYADLFMTQSLIAIRKVVPAILLCGTRAVLTYGLSYGLTILWDYQGLALGFSLALVINLLFFFPVFFHKTPFASGWKNLFINGLKFAVAASPVLFIGWFLNRWPVADWVKLPGVATFFLIAVIAILGSGFYLFLLKQLRINEINTLYESLKNNWLHGEWGLVDTVN